MGLCFRKGCELGERGASEFDALVKIRVWIPDATIAIGRWDTASLIRFSDAFSSLDAAARDGSRRMLLSGIFAQDLQ